jgi:hypothetical protein
MKNGLYLSPNVKLNLSHSVLSQIAQHVRGQVSQQLNGTFVPMWMIRASFRGDSLRIDASHGR